MNILSPILITGSYRTGSTLLSRILDTHPDLNIPYDSVQFMRMTFGHYDPLGERWQEALDNIIERTSERLSIDLNRAELSDAFQATDGGYGDLYQIVMESLLGPGRWGEKTNICWEQIPDYIDMFPNGKVLLIIRDPRDGLASFKSFTYEPDLHYLDAAYNFLSSLDAASRYTKSLDPSSFHVVRYEDLIADAEYTIKKVCRFLNVSFIPKMLDVGSFGDNSGRPWDGNTTSGKRPTNISADAVGGWKKKLTSAEVAFVELICASAMLTWNYELSAPSLNENDWTALRNYTEYAPLADRYQNWQLTRTGFQGFPNDTL